MVSHMRRAERILAYHEKLKAIQCRCPSESDMLEKFPDEKLMLDFLISRKYLLRRDEGLVMTGRGYAGIPGFTPEFQQRFGNEVWRNRNQKYKWGMVRSV